MTKKIPKKVLTLINQFQKANWEIYLVGGAARDIFLGRKIVDWDFTTNASPEKIQTLFPKNSFYHNRFGTVSIVVRGKKKSEVFEVTTFRREFGYSDKRHPDKIIWGKTLEEDLSRRDFTIGAIALKIDQINLQKNSYRLQVIDPFKGREDLKRKIVRAVGDPDQRFSEDALRMIRAIRIAAQLGFIIEEKTFASIKRNAPLIGKIAPERIREELLKILASPYPAEGFTFLLNAGILKIIIPELAETYGVTQAKHHRDDVWTHSLKSLKFCPSPDPIVRFATLLHDVGKPVVAQGEGEERTFYNHEVIGAAITKRIAQRLRFSREESHRLWLLVRWHQFTVNENQTDKAIKRFIRRVGKENLKDMIDLRIGDRLGGGARRTSWRLELFKKRLAEVQKQPFSLKDLKVNGHDVMRLLHLPPGPQVGKILNLLFNEVEENQELNQRDYLLSRIPQVAEKLTSSPKSHSKPPKEERQ